MLLLIANRRGEFSAYPKRRAMDAVPAEAADAQRSALRRDERRKMWTPLGKSTHVGISTLTRLVRISA